MLDCYHLLLSSPCHVSSCLYLKLLTIKIPFATIFTFFELSLSYLKPVVAHAISILNYHIVLFVSATFALIASCLAIINKRRLAQQESKQTVNDCCEVDHFSQNKYDLFSKISFFVFCLQAFRNVMNNLRDKYIEEENDKIKDTINRL